MLVGHEAVDIGLINEVGGLSKAVNKLREMINKKKEGDKQYHDTLHAGTPEIVMKGSEGHKPVYFQIPSAGDLLR